MIKLTDLFEKNSKLTYAGTETFGLNRIQNMQKLHVL